MATKMRRRPTIATVLTIAALLASLGLAVPATAQTTETPRRGGVLLIAIGADAPGLDPHQEQTFATLQPNVAALQHAPADRSVQLPRTSSATSRPNGRSRPTG